LTTRRRILETMRDRALQTSTDVPVQFVDIQGMKVDGVPIA